MLRYLRLIFMLLICFGILSACSNVKKSDPPPNAFESKTIEQQTPPLKEEPDESDAVPKKTVFKRVYPNDDVRDMSAFRDFSDDHIVSPVFEEGEYNLNDIPTLRYNEGTTFKGSESLANEILENGKNPGLGVRGLHEQGVTGKGVNVAIIDSPMFLNHPEYTGKIVQYYDTAIENPEMGSMHGPAVTSMLVGTEIGTAPDARVYYVARSIGLNQDNQDVAEGLNWIVEQNENLSDSQKIRIVSISDDLIDYSLNQDAYTKACQFAESQGILVIDANSFVWSAYYAYGDDPEDVKSYKAGYPIMGPQSLSAQRIAAPASLRSMAEHYAEDSPSYASYGNGGVSFAIPYTAGVLALGWQVNPALDKDKMVELLLQTAYVNSDGANIINPPLFIEAVKKTIH